MRQHLPVISRIIGGLFGIAVGCVIGGIAVVGVAITILVTGVISLGFISMAAGLLMLAISLVPYLFVVWKTPSQILSRYDI